MSEAAIPAPIARERFWDGFGRDLFRYFVYQPSAGMLRKLFFCLTVEGIWALAAYRMGRALLTAGGAAMVLWPFFRAWELAVRLLTGIQLDVQAEIGPGLYVGHHGSIYVGPGTRMGPDCNIGQMCYVGAAIAAAGTAPVIGSRVYLGPGSKVVGAVKIGERAAVGAGAVVLEDVPGGTTVVGNPARVLRNAGSDDLIYLGEGTPPLSGSQLGAAR